MTDPHNPDFQAAVERAARQYVLRAMEETRAFDPDGDLDNWPVLNAEQVSDAYDELRAEASKADVGFPPDRELPVIREDGYIHYCRTIETMDQETVNAALVTLAAEYAWLAHHQAQRVEEFAALLNLRRLNGWLESGES